MYTSVYIYIYMYLNLSIHIYMCIYIHICKCLHMHTYIHLYMDMYIHIRWANIRQQLPTMSAFMISLRQIMWYTVTAFGTPLLLFLFYLHYSPRTCA